MPEAQSESEWCISPLAVQRSLFPPLVAHSDLIGRVQIPVKQLMETPNKMFRRADSFKGFEDADSMPGKLHWSIGFFEKASLKKELERPMTPEEAKAAPAPTKTAPAMEMRPDDKGAWMRSHLQTLEWIFNGNPWCDISFSFHSAESSQNGRPTTATGAHQDPT